jgi:hypothetical protein
MDADMLRDIADEGYAGGVLFEWTDEWFKHTWNTMDLSLPVERMPLWHNVLTNESQFGVLAVDPGARPAVTVDGRTGDWARTKPLLTGADELRVKESDRIGTISQELSQLGVAVETRADGLVIKGGRPRPALLKSHGDHRIAMAAAVAANACEGASTVRGWAAVASSYPAFWEHLDQVTARS